MSVSETSENSKSAAGRERNTHGCVLIETRPPRPYGFSRSCATVVLVTPESTAVSFPFLLNLTLALDTPHGNPIAWSPLAITSLSLSLIALFYVDPTHNSVDPTHKR